MPRARRPNVVCFVMDQLRYDHLGCTGNGTVETPNIDSLAERGVTFDRSYVANPLCMPNRASLFTGLPPRTHGVRTNGIPLPEEVPTVVESLRDDGYRTASVGKLHAHHWVLPESDAERLDVGDLDPAAYPEAKAMWKGGHVSELPEPYYGFERTDFVGGHSLEGGGVWGEYEDWVAREAPEMVDRLDRGHAENVSRDAPNAFEWAIPEDLHYNRWISANAREFIADADDGSDPFFLWCSFPDPHHDYAVPEPWATKYDPSTVSLPTRREGELADLPPHYRHVYHSDDTLLAGIHGQAERSDRQLREIKALTYGMISFVDREIGRVLDALDERDLRRETVVVFLSDHGDMMGDHWMIRKGPFHFEGLLRVPMIWSWPGEFPEGKRTAGLASAIDFAPTVLDLCGVPEPSGGAMVFRDTPGEERVERPVRPVKTNEAHGNMQTYTEVPRLMAGRSLRPQITGRTASVRDGVVVENDEDYLGLRLRTYITDRHKLTMYPGEDGGELFDLDEDPDELYNRWDDPDAADLKGRLYRDFLDLYVREEGAYPARDAHA